MGDRMFRSLATVIIFSLGFSLLQVPPAAFAQEPTPQEELVSSEGTTKPIETEKLETIGLELVSEDENFYKIKLSANIENFISEDAVSIIDSNSNSILKVCTVLNECTLTLAISENYKLHAQSGTLISNELILSKDIENKQTRKLNTKEESAFAVSEEWEIDLATDKNIFKTGESPVLTATNLSTIAVNANGIGIYVFDVTTNTLIREWPNTNTIETAVHWDALKKNRDYKAYIANWNGWSVTDTISDLINIKAESSIVTLERADWTLSVSSSGVNEGGQEELDFSKNQATGPSTVYQVVAYNESTGEWVKEEQTAYNFFLPSAVITSYIGIPSMTGDKVTGVYDVQARGNVVFISSSFVRAYNIGRTSFLSTVFSGTNPSQVCYQLCVADPVSTLTGEYWDSIEDVQSLTGFTPPLNFIRTYSAFRSNENIGLGNGWLHNYDMKILTNNENPETTTTSLLTTPIVDIYQENGSTITFYRTPSGDYLAPKRSEATLVYEEETFILERFSGEKFVFNSIGKLITVEDRNKNQLSLSYDSSDRLILIKDLNSNKTIQLVWGVAGKITSVVTSTGQNVSYAYTANNLKSVNDVGGKTTSYSYNSSNKIIKKINPDTTEVNNEYDTEGRVEYQYDELNRPTRFVYSSVDDGSNITGVTEVQTPDEVWTSYTYLNGQITKIIKDDGGATSRTTKYEYDKNGRLAKEINPLLGSKTFLYDNNGNPISTTNELNQTTTVTYDLLNNPLVTTDPMNKTITNTYDSFGRLITVKDALNNVVTMTWNSKGLPLGSITATGATINYAYDASGFLVESTDALGKATTYSNNTYGQALITTNALGQKNIVERNEYGDITKIIDNANNMTILTYDNRRRLKNTLYPNSRSTQTIYDDFGMPIEQIDELGNILTTEYDSMSRVLKVTSKELRTTQFTYNKHGEILNSIDGLAKKTIFTYNKNGQKLTQKSPSGKTTSYQYDALGQLIKQTNPDSTIKVFVFDASGNNTHSIDEENRVLQYTYNMNNALVAVTRPDSKLETYTYNADGKQVNYTDALANIANYTYDLNGNIIETEESGINYKYTYNDIGNVIRKTNLSDNSYVNYDFNNLNLVTNVSHSDATILQTYTYNNMSRVTNINDSSGSNVYTYDIKGRVIGINNSITGLVSYTYDKDDNQKTIKYPSTGTTTYTYNNNAQVTKVNSTTMGDITYSYNIDRALNVTTFPNGLKTTNTYDNVNQLDQQKTINSSAANVFTYDYNYDSSGIMIQKNTTTLGIVDNKSYSYDSLKRLSSVNNGAAVTPVLYNDINSLTQTSDGKELTYGANQKLTSLVKSSIAKSYTYDARGNRATATTVNGISTIDDVFTYNAANQLITADLSANLAPTSKTNINYSYNSYGLRTQKTKTDSSGTKTTNYIWDITQSVPTLLEDSKYKYVYSLSSTPVAQINKTTNKVEFFHTDNIGSIRGITSATGIIVAEYLYDEYGNIIGGQPAHTSTAFGYAGEFKDEDISFYYLRGRWYDPYSGQFTSVDMLLNQTHLSYSYTQGNPLQYVDPNGFKSEKTSSTGLTSHISPLPAVLSGLCNVYNWSTSYAYEYPHEIANPIGYSAEQAMDIFKANPEEVFPFNVEGCSSFSTGEICTLHALEMNNCPDPASCKIINSVAHGTGDVRVSTTSTSVTFEVITEGYFDPIGSKITFRTKMNKGKLMLIQETKSRTGLSGAIGVKLGVAKFNWFQQANNFTDLLSEGK
jgi:RHS repeat-associated protein